MKNKILECYEKLINQYNIELIEENEKISFYIKKCLNCFISECVNPAIWCNGVHTKMLMADYVFELKRIKYIIDTNIDDVTESGFGIISKDDILDKQIDGIIISSYKYRNEIKSIINSDFPEVKYLDIYDELEAMGIHLSREYYSGSHPYDSYKELNDNIRKYRKNNKEEFAKRIIDKLVQIKDFRMLTQWAAIFFNELGDDKYFDLAKDSEEIYSNMLDYFGKICEKNVLLVCLDGLRYEDLSKLKMPKVYQFLAKNSAVFNNAYAVSTSTYESLIPAYSENTDLRTQYYKTNLIKKDGCRFINHALEQGRKIVFYTDSSRYVDNHNIIVKNYSQTLTEKIWSFMKDSENECNGLFLLHELYESHYSYPNPYSTEKIIADGSSIIFDFLSKNGGAVRTNYVRQHDDSLKYIDDTLAPVLDRLKCSFLIYADHGGVVYTEKKKLEEVSYTDCSFGQELIRIPMAIKSANMPVTSFDELVSLFSINDIVISLLDDYQYINQTREYIKIQRSKIYNPDFVYLYKKMGYERAIRSFELFVFSEGYKLVVYDNKEVELYSMTDVLLNKSEILERLLLRITDEITVCEFN